VSEDLAKVLRAAQLAKALKQDVDPLDAVARQLGVSQAELVGMIIDLIRQRLEAMVADQPLAPPTSTSLH
jgi:hypothetical protein